MTWRPSDARFSERACPACGALAHRVLIDVAAVQIFESNWSYRREALTGLEGVRDTYPIQQCTACGFIYAGLLPDDEFLAHIYDSVIDDQAAARDNLGHSAVAGKMIHLAAFLRLLPARPPARVLDFGCGFGSSLALLATIRTLDVVGFETSAKRAAKLARCGLPATSSEDDVLARGPYEGVLLDNVLEHVPDPRSTLRRLRRACGTGAVLFVSVPDLGRETIVASGHAAQLRMDINPWEHLNYFDIEQLDAMLASAGFTPLAQARLPRDVDIGVRPDVRVMARLANGAASVIRLLRYIADGEAVASPGARFYRAA